MGMLSAAAAENEVSAQTLAAMKDDYYFIEPIDTGIPSFSDYYDMYAGESRPKKTVEIRGEDYLSAENGGFSVGSYGTGDDVRDNVLIW